MFIKQSTSWPILMYVYILCSTILQSKNYLMVTEVVAIMTHFSERDPETREKGGQYNLEAVHSTQPKRGLCNV